MIIIQLTGLSGAGKSTLAFEVASALNEKNIKVEVLDGDIYRRTLNKDLGFSAEDRQENIRRLGFVAEILSRNGIVSIISAINPFEKTRNEVKNNSPFSKIVYIHCEVPTLIDRDTKGLYARAFLPDSDPEKLNNLSGINDVYEVPQNPDLIIDTSVETIRLSTEKLLTFILNELEFLKQSH